MGPPPQERAEGFLGNHISRRALIKGAILGIGANILESNEDRVVDYGQCIIENDLLSFPDPTVDLKDYARGFKGENDFREALINSTQTKDIPISSIATPEDPESLFTGVFTLKEPTYVIIKTNGSPTPFKNIQLLDIRLDDGKNPEEEYYHPILDTEQDKSATTTFHDRTPGDYKVTIRRTDHSYGIRPEDLNLSIQTVTTDSPLFQAIIRRSLIVRLRRDNLQNVIQNMPVRSRWDMSINDEGVHLVRYSQDLLGQNGGTDPCRAKHPDDRETYAMDKFTEDGLLLDQVGEEGKHHTRVTYPLVSIPSKVIPGMGIDLVIMTQNNIPSRDPREFTEKRVSLFDEYLLLPEQKDEQRSKAIMINAYQEWWRRGELDKQTSEVDLFINEKLGGVDIIRT